MADTYLSENALAETLERFVRVEGRIAPDDIEFTRAVDLFGSGYLDSLGTVHLIAYIEERFCCELNDDVLADPRFASIDGISAIVAAVLRSGTSSDRPAPSVERR